MRIRTLLPALLLTAALPGCSPTAEAPIDTTASQIVLRAAVRQETAIDSKTLADRLLANPEGLALIDLRTPEAYRQDRIERAERMDPADLFNAELPPERDLVVYGADGALGAQAVALLRLNGRQRSYFLSGGYAGWTAYLGAEVADSATDTRAAREAARRAAAACRFEGEYVAAAGLAPKVDAPAQGSGGYRPAVQPAAAPKPAADSLGLGLGLGLGPAPQRQQRGQLKIGEGC